MLECTEVNRKSQQHHFPCRRDQAFVFSNCVKICSRLQGFRLNRGCRRHRRLIATASSYLFSHLCFLFRLRIYYALLSLVLFLRYVRTYESCMNLFGCMSALDVVTNFVDVFVIAVAVSGFVIVIFTIFVSCNM